jgi:GntR family transcriptional regulator
MAARQGSHRGFPDDALPSGRQLAADLGVSRITVRKAIQGLADEGCLDQRQGSGNVVSTRIDKHFAELTSFSEDMRSRGRTPRSGWIQRSSGTVSPEEAMKRTRSPGSLVDRCHRLRYADDAPMAIESSPSIYRGDIDDVVAELKAA